MTISFYKYFILYWTLVKCDETIICINSDSNNSNTDCTKTLSDIAITNEAITCPQRSNCSLKCFDPSSCQSLTVNCPVTTNTNCNVYCYDSLSCSSTTINASHSNELIIDCSGHQSCQNINIYCPINNTQCTLKGSDASIHSKLNIYAINGWKDINMTAYNATINKTNDNRMHCGNKYMDSCLISNVAWSCMDSNHICNTKTGIGVDVPTTPWIIGGAAGFLIICALCCLCILTQYRRHREDLHKVEAKEKQKSTVYGADAMDDTMYLGNDDEVETFKITDRGALPVHGIRVVSDDDEDEDYDQDEEVERILKPK